MEEQFPANVSTPPVTTYEMAEQVACPDIVLDSGVSIQDLIRQHDEVLNDVAKHRARLSAKVNKAIDGMTIQPDGDPEVLEAQIRLLEQGDKFLQSREKAFLTRIQLRLKNQESDAQNKVYGAMATKILRELDANKVSPYVVNQSETIDLEALDAIEQQLNGLEAIDLDSGETRKDSTDMS